MFREEYPVKNSWLIQQYYSLVGNSLTELQKKHFTAFSQHFGFKNLFEIMEFFNVQSSQKSP